MELSKSTETQGSSFLNNERIPRDHKQITKDESSLNTHKSKNMFLLLLVGLPGSGKSTFADILTSQNSQYHQVNQDMLKKRKKCESQARKTIEMGKIPIIDRCNFDATQRKYFIDIASEYNIPIEIIVFDFPVDLCVKRCKERKNHKTLGPDKAEAVIKMLKRQFQVPTFDESDMGVIRKILFLNSTEMVTQTILEYKS